MGQGEAHWRSAMPVRRLVSVKLSLALALACAACASPEPPTAIVMTERDTPADAAGRGHQLAARACAVCHAIGAKGPSPMAEATPFGEVVHRYPLDQLEEAFAEGLVTGHPAMPAFVFRASEIDDLIAYLETVEVEP